MRPTTRPQSALQAPLNDILGTEVNVRILRWLAESQAPVTAGELARRTQLGRTSVYPAIETLSDSGVIERVGAGTQRLVRLSGRHPLASAIRALFAAERARTEALFDGIRVAANALMPPPAAVWVEGPVASGTDRAGDAVLVRVLDDAGRVDNTAEHLRNALANLERKLDVTIEVSGTTRADLRERHVPDNDRLLSAMPMLGVPPSAFASRTSAPTRRDASGSKPTGSAAKSARSVRVRSHAAHDTHALALARAIGDKLARDPDLRARALERIARRLERASAGERSELAEWDRILRTTSAGRLRRLLVAPGERSTRLRQTLPFLGVISQDERDAIVAGAARERARKGEQ